MLYAIVAVLVIIVDQWIKYWVAGAIPLESTGEAFIPGILSLVNLHNDGAAFSFLAGGGARIYFIILTGAFTVAVIIALATRFISGRLARWCLVLVTAGGVSNCIDRVIYGYVQDMFKTEFINFPVFNLADVFITVFCVLFVIAILFERDRDDDEDDEYANLTPDEAREVLIARLIAYKQFRNAAAALAGRMEAARRAARYEDDDEDDEEEEERPRRAQRKQAKNSQPPVDEEYEQYKAAKAAREKALAQERAQQQARQRQAAAAQQQAQQQRAADPFAEWERATAQPAARPAQQSSVPQQPVQQRPAQQPAAAKPAAKPASSSDEFSLDDILAEFK